MTNDEYSVSYMTKDEGRTTAVIRLLSPVLDPKKLDRILVAWEAKAWYDSPAYREAREHRFRGADYRAILFEGL